jgi:hypothetical protein
VGRRVAWAERPRWDANANKGDYDGACVVGGAEEDPGRSLPSQRASHPGRRRSWWLLSRVH